MTDMATGPKASGRLSLIALLYVARGLRGFGDGFAVIILPAYLSAIGFNAVDIEIVATAALLGSSLFTLAIGFLAPKRDPRNLLIAGGPDGRNRDCISERRACRVDDAGGVHRHDQPEHRRHRHPGAFGTCHAGHGRDG